MSARIFTEDEVVLKEDPSITALVEMTWQDPDGSIPPRAHLISHRRISIATIRACVEQRALVKGLVIIKFVEPPVGLALVHEEDLLLKDRGLCVGDIVKRQGSFAESGYVVKTSLECDCRPVYPGLPHSGNEPWPHKEEDNEIRVGSEDLELLGFTQGRIVIYKGWIGEVMDMSEEVTVRMSDGSVVRISNLDELEVYSVESSSDLQDRLTSTLSLAESVRLLHRAWKEKPDPAMRQPPDPVYPGQLVCAKKSVFRLGSWVIGSYTPSIPPQGHIVEIHISSIEVDWLTCNVFDGDKDSQPPRPDSIIESHELTQVLTYNRNNLTDLTTTGRNYGARQSQDIVIGDPVAFRSTAAAAEKYKHSGINRNAGGGFRKVPRAMANGFDINTLRVIGTKQYAIVQWQSGAVTHEESTNLTPDVAGDENDYFVGELCSLRSADTTADGIITLNKVGVIQSMDAHERTVKVRWYSSANVMLFEGVTSDILPGSVLGELEEEVAELSVYDIVSYPALAKRRGDLVLIQPAELTDKAEPSPSSSLHDNIRWFGEVVDLGTDGFVTIRLGALERVEDIRVPTLRVHTVVGSDGASVGNETTTSMFEDEDYIGRESWGSESESRSATSDMDVIEETISYEGEPPDDPGDDDAWMTDASDELDGEDTSMKDEKPEDEKSIRPTKETPTSNGTAAATIATEQEGSEAQIPTISDTTYLDYSFSGFPNKPPQFEMLDSAPPDDHHFVNQRSSLTAKLLRRIRKEHKILAELPAGIWVRTWSEALYLMRILIVGPRNTPYELAPFVLDVHFMDDFPHSPPAVYFHSWTYGVGRINPNLYEDGKVCLSILGTWPHDRRNEGWNSNQSSLLQVLVSLMGLVLVEEPYYNEAGFEALVGTEETAFASQTYTQKAYCMSKGFMEYALRHGVAGLDDVLQWLYTARNGPRLLAQIIRESRHVVEASSRSEPDDEARFPGSFAAKLRISAGAQMLLRRHLEKLEKRAADLD